MNKRKIALLILSTFIPVSIACSSFSGMPVNALENVSNITTAENAEEDATDELSEELSDELNSTDEFSNLDVEDDNQVGNDDEKAVGDNEDIFIESETDKNDGLEQAGEGVTVGVTTEEADPIEAVENDSSNIALTEDSATTVEEAIEVEKEKEATQAEAGSVVASGTCETDITWKITEESDNYSLIIEGSGRFAGFKSMDEIPWKSYISSIKSVLIQGNITYIGDYAFYGANNLETVTIPNSVTTIGTRAFYNCSKLGSIVIPDSVTTINKEAFAFCDSLDSVVFSSNLTAIGEGAFNSSGIRDANFGGNGITFGNSAFESCKKLETVTFASEKANSFSDKCFKDCSSLRDIKITEYTSLLPEKCFYNCPSLKTIIVPVMTRIYKAFGKSGLTDVYFKGTREQWATKNIEYDYNDDSLRSAKIHYGTNGEEISGLIFDPSTVEIEEGEIVDISQYIEPWTAIEEGLRYDSSDSTIVTVDKNGVVKGKKGGTVTVSAHLNDTDLTASCKIVVRTKVNEIKFDKEQIHLANGRYETINAEVLPEEAYDKTLIWKSSNTSVATVDAKGNIKAVGIGETVITAVDRYNNATQSCNVKVYQPINSLNFTLPQLEMEVGNTIPLNVTATPDDNIYDVYDWESSDNTIVKVDPNGYASAVGAGNAVITCRAKDGTEEYASCSVTVVLPVKSIEIVQKQIELKKGDTIRIDYTVLPENANNKSVIWKSSDESIVAVDSIGNITAKKSGSAVISCISAEKPNVTAECAVTVKVPITGIVLNNTDISLYREQSVNLITTLYPFDTTEKDIIWSSSNNSVASVDETGKVTGVGKGTAVIRCQSAESDSIFGECVVNVGVPVESMSLSRDNASLFKGNSVKLTAMLEPEDITDDTVVWKSSDENVATVDRDGLVISNSVGVANITCISKDNPAVRQTCKVTVIDMINGAEIQNIQNKSYTGKEITQEPTVVLKDGAGLILLNEDTDYSVSYEKNINAGTATVIITGKGYYIGSATKTFTIKKIPNTITAKSMAKSYSAQVQSFDLAVKVKNGTPTYKSNNKSVTVNKAGKVTVKAKFIGNATITITSPASTNYTSVKKNIVIKVVPTKTKFTSATNNVSKKMTLKWVKRTNATGYVIQYSTSSTFSGAKTVRIDKNATVSRTIGNLVKDKKYYVRIKTFKTVSGTKYYSGWSDVMSVTIKK